MGLSAIDDSVVGAPHRNNEIRMRWTQRRRSHAVDDPLDGKAKLERLVERHFKCARDNLRGAGEALGGSENDCQLPWRKPAITRNLFNDRWWRHGGAFQHQRAAIRVVGVTELLEQRL